MPNKLAVSLILAVSILPALQGCGGAEARKARALERGQQYLAAQNYPKASVEFKNALQIDPNDADALYYIGFAAEKSGDLRNAAQAYRGALNVNATHARAAAAMARLYVFSGLAQQGLDLTNKALADTPDDPDLVTVKAAAELALGHDQEAFDAASKVLAEHPGHEQAVALVAGIHRRRGEDQEAVTLLERAVAAAPKSVDLHTVLARLYADTQANDRAEAEFKTVIELKPDDPAEWRQLAAFYASTDRPKDAEATLRQVIRLEPKVTAHKLALVNYILSQHSFDAAEKELLAMLAQDPKDDDLRIAAGEFYQAHNLPDDAERTFEKVIDSAGKTAPGLAARNRLAALFVQTNRATAAQPLIAEVLEENPRDNDALVLRASLALAGNRPLDAITDLRAVLRDQPDSPSVLRTLARAHAQNAEPDLARESYRRAIEVDPGNVDTRLEYAGYLTARHELDEAGQLLDTVLGTEPTNLRALELKYQIAMAKPDRTVAEDTAKQVLKYYPEHPIGYYLRGLLEQSAGDLKAAQASFELSLAKAPRGAEPLSALTSLLVRSGQRAEARERLEKAVEEMPDHAVALNLLAELLVGDHELDRAVTTVDRAIAAAPTWWTPYRTKALARLASNDTAGAEQVYEEGMKAAGDPASLGVDLASLYERTKQPDKAIEIYEKLQRKNPTSEPLANNLAMLLTTYRDDDASREQARELVQNFRDSDNPAYLNTYGWVSYRQGRLDEAITYLRRAVTAQPDNPLMRYQLGKALYDSGDADQARTELETAVKSDRTFLGKDDAEALLAKLAARG
jgi:tetratricopeptide (TPR) repeat protein